MPCSWHRMIGSLSHLSRMIRSKLRAAADTPIYMGCYGARPCPMHLSRRLRRPIGPSQGRTFNRRDDMLKKKRWVSAALALTALSTLASVSLGAGSAEAAVVYCKTAGVPQGCVVRPAVPFGRCTRWPRPLCGTSVIPACGAEAHDPEKWLSEKILRK